MESVSNCSSGQVSTAVFTQLIGTIFMAQCGLKSAYPSDCPSSGLLDKYDFIVVGAGSAGSALAARLVANPDWNVLLIEAGKDPSLDSDTPSFLFSLQHSEEDWKYFTTPQKNGCNAFKDTRCYWPRGKLLGGSSGINAMLYQTGNRRDYDEWEELTGSSEWGWKAVEPVFLEQFDEVGPEPANHDRNDPIEFEFDRIRKYWISAAKRIGYTETRDPLRKSQSHTGFFKSLLTIKNGTRNNAARIFLSPIANASNLHVLKNALVTKVLIDPITSQVYGVEVFLHNTGEVKQIKVSKEVILSAGSLNTPQLLMLSGIGPKEILSRFNISCIIDLPVGKNLMDHPVVYLPVKMNPSGKFRVYPGESFDEYYKYLMHRTGIVGTVGVIDTIGFINTFDRKSPYPNIGYYSPYYLPGGNLVSRLKSFNFNDSVIEMMTDVNRNNSILTVLVTLLKPKSRGTLTLSSSDPKDPPVLDPNYNSNSDDVDVLIEGIRRVEDMIQSRDFKRAQAELVRFDLPECNGFTYDSSPYWQCYVRYFTTTLYHPVGTCRMGRGAEAVVDDELRVHGVKGLRVVDGSVMPNIVGANTNAPIMMIAVKAAEFIKRSYGT